MGERDVIGRGHAIWRNGSACAIQSKFVHVCKDFKLHVQVDDPYRFSGQRVKLILLYIHVFIPISITLRKICWQSPNFLQRLFITIGYSLKSKTHQFTPFQIFLSLIWEHFPFKTTFKHFYKTGYSSDWPLGPRSAIWYNQVKFWVLFDQYIENILLDSLQTSYTGWPWRVTHTDTCIQVKSLKVTKFSWYPHFKYCLAPYLE